MILPSSCMLMTSDQNPVVVHQSTFIRFSKKRKMSTQSYIKYYLRTLLILSHPRVPRLAHLYGLPKTHKANLSMRPILSATGTNNYTWAKWLEEKLKSLSVNDFTITDAIRFSVEIRNSPIGEDDILVSCCEVYMK